MKKARIVSDINQEIYNRLKMATIYSKHKKSNIILEKALAAYLETLEKEHEEDIKNIFSKNTNMPDDMFKTEIKEYKALNDEESE